jgi:hypothetical protein
MLPCSHQPEQQAQDMKPVRATGRQHGGEAATGGKQLRTAACRQAQGAPATLTQPAARALAAPTTLVLNMLVHQNWHATKVASEKPMNRRLMMKPAALVDMPMQ